MGFSQRQASALGRDDDDGRFGGNYDREMPRTIEFAGGRWALDRHRR
jgi:hypothetical protein